MTPPAVRAHRWVAALLLGACAAAVAVGVRFVPRPVVQAEPTRTARPVRPPFEFTGADAEVVRRIREAYGQLDVYPPWAWRESDSTSDVGKWRRVEAVLDAEPTSASPSLLLALRELGAASRSGNLKFTISSSESMGRHDRANFEASWLRGHRAAASDALLVALLRERDEEAALRELAVVVLASADTPEMLEPLVDLALDAGEVPSLRAGALLRLPRFGRRPPTRLRDLLYLPAHDLDVTAAAALAAAGDWEAPPLAIENLRRAFRSECSARESTAAALVLDAFLGHSQGAAGVNTRLLPVAAHFLEHGLSSTETSDGVTVHREDMSELVLQIEAWFAENDPEPATAFERARWTYLTSDRRRHELTYAQLDDLLIAPDAEFDLGAALLVPRVAPEQASKRLEQLDRLAALVRREAGAAPKPADWIAALNRRVLGGAIYTDDGPESCDLDAMLGAWRGSCATLSALYLAVGERLGLPLHPVFAPHHVFVRWDDGTLRRNIETTTGGEERSDAWYRRRDGGFAIDRRDAVAGLYLANVSKRRFAAVLDANAASQSLADWDADAALAFAERAVRLDPTHPLAFVNLARARLAARPAEAEAAAGDARRALSLARPTSALALHASAVLLAAGAAEEALRVADDALAAAAGPYPPLEFIRVFALARLSRWPEAASALDLSRARSTEDARLAAVELAILRGDPDWLDRLDAMVRGFGKAVQFRPTGTDTPSTQPPADSFARDVRLNPRPHLAVADHLLSGMITGRPELERAAFVLDRLKEYDRLGAVMTLSSTAPLETFAPLSRFVANRRYFALRARLCRLSGDDAGAEAALERMRRIKAR